MPRVLIVEDDAAMRDMVGYALAEEGMEVEAVADGESALEIFSRSGPFDLVILDVMLPGIDGVSVCKELTSKSDVPIIMLTARDDETSVVVGLEVGADDYVTKPFSTRQLVSRVRANLRRRRLDAQAVGQKLVFPDLVVDIVNREVLVRGNSVCLTTKEFDILKLLATHPGRGFSREQIVRQVWGIDFFGGARSVDTHVGHIRKKIEADLKNPCYIR